MLQSRNTTKLSVLVGLLFAVGFSRPADGVTIAADYFVYPVGSSLAGEDGGSGFSGA